MEPVTRRHVLAGLAGLSIATVTGRSAGVHASEPRTGPAPDLATLEARYDRRVGVYARNVSTGAELAHRADERFPILSVFKTLLAGLVLETTPPTELRRRLTWSASDVVQDSPVTGATVRNGLTVAQLCEAAVTRSDNTAANVLMREYGGPPQVTQYARSLGDTVTRLDRWEPELNSAIPGDPRDTTTPRAIAGVYERLVLDGALRRPERAVLLGWMLANQTTGTRFGAGVPAGWRLADKTGGGAHGARNDVGVAWTPRGTPIVIAALTTGDDPADAGQDGLLADVAAHATAQLAS